TSWPVASRSGRSARPSTPSPPVTSNCIHFETTVRRSTAASLQGKPVRASVSSGTLIAVGSIKRHSRTLAYLSVTGCEVLSGTARRYRQKRHRYGRSPRLHRTVDARVRLPRAALDRSFSRSHGKVLRMRATLMYGAGDVRVEDVPDAGLIDPTDALVRVTRAAICGSDLWPYHSIL